MKKRKNPLLSQSVPDSLRSMPVKMQKLGRGYASGAMADHIGEIGTEPLTARQKSKRILSATREMIRDYWSTARKFRPK